MTKPIICALMGGALSFAVVGCSEEPADTADGRDARQVNKEAELGGSPSAPAPGQWDANLNAQSFDSGGDPDRM